MTKLLQNRVLGGLTPESVVTYGSEIKTSRAKLVATPVVDDEIYKTYDKMGSTRRSEATETLKVLKTYKGVLPSNLSLMVVDNGLSVYDNADAAIEHHNAQITDLTRLKGMGGVTAHNMLKCIEDYLYQQADHGSEDAILIKNAIEKLTRSSDRKSDRKSGGKNDKGDNKTNKGGDKAPEK